MELAKQAMSNALSCKGLRKLPQEEQEEERKSKFGRLGNNLCRINIMKHAMCDEIVHGHVGIKLVGRFLKKKVQQSFDFIRNSKKQVMQLSVLFHNETRNASRNCSVSFV